MKKLILIVIIFKFTFALVQLKKDFIAKINYFTPEYLRISPEESFFNLKAEYNSITKKASYSLHIHLRLPAISAKYKKVKSNTKKTIMINFKTRPYIRLKKGKIKLFLSNSIKIEKKAFFKTVLLERLDVYVDNFWENLVEFSVNKNKTTFTASYNKTKTSNDSYTIGTYYAIKNDKKITVFGLQRHIQPNDYTLFVSYRHTLFHSKRVYLEIKPYLLYTNILKPAFDVNINYKF